MREPEFEKKKREVLRTTEVLMLQNVMCDKNRVPLLEIKKTPIIEEVKYMWSVTVKEERETSPVLMVSI